MTPFGGSWESIPRKPDYLTLASFLEDHGFQEDAIFFDQLANRDKALRYYGAALELLDSNKIDEGLASLNESVRLDNAYWPAHLVLGNTYARLSKKTRQPHSEELLRLARNAYLRTIELDANNFDAHLGIALVYAQQRKTNLATESAARAVQLRPEAWEARLAYARLLVDNKEFSLAIEQFELIRNQQPENADLMLEQAIVHRLQREFDKAIELNEKALDLQPGNATIEKNLAHSYLIDGNFRAAAEKLEKRIARDELDSESKLKLAWILATDPDEAARNGKRAIELALQAETQTGSTVPIFNEVLAAAYAEGGKFSEANHKQALALQGMRRGKGFTQASNRLELYKKNRPFRQVDRDSNPFSY
jgi:tetratricopeptide (TPR) repeat protein